MCHSQQQSPSYLSNAHPPRVFQLLYRCVEAVNLTHDRVHAQMDVKLRSLICMGLNEQVLHLWLESICSNAAVVQKWYQPWSFMSSPGWVQVGAVDRVFDTEILQT